jgi:hypothetical protein
MSSPFRPSSAITASTDTSLTSSTGSPQTTKDKEKKRKTVSISSEPTSSFAKTPPGKFIKKQKFQYDDAFDIDSQPDLTTQEGQMKTHPTMTGEAAATEARREYNRRNASRTRKRNKLMVGDLQESVGFLTERVGDLERSNHALRMQLKDQQTRNRDILVGRRDTEKRAQVQSSNEVMLQLVQQLHRRNEAQQYMQTISQLLSTPNGLHGAFRTK